MALDVRREVNSHPRISKYFRVLGADEMTPVEFRNSGFVDYLTSGVNWATVVKALREDEFALDVTRVTLVCGSAGFDGIQFKNLLAADLDIQLTSPHRLRRYQQYGCKPSCNPTGAKGCVLTTQPVTIERDYTRQGPLVYGCATFCTDAATSRIM